MRGGADTAYLYNGSFSELVFTKENRIPSYSHSSFLLNWAEYHPRFFVDYGLISSPVFCKIAQCDLRIANG